MLQSQYSFQEKLLSPLFVSGGLFITIKSELFCSLFFSSKWMTCWLMRAVITAFHPPWLWITWDQVFPLFLQLYIFHGQTRRCFKIWKLMQRSCLMGVLVWNDFRVHENNWHIMLLCFLWFSVIYILLWCWTSWVSACSECSICKVSSWSPSKWHQIKGHLLETNQWESGHIRRRP